jgi:hypothetical protein
MDDANTSSMDERVLLVDGTVAEVQQYLHTYPDGSEMLLVCYLGDEKTEEQWVVWAERDTDKDGDWWNELP